MPSLVRDVTEHLQHNFQTFRGWHPLYASLSGAPSPCIEEYTRLVECMNDKTTDCAKEYRALIVCLKHNGVHDN